METNKNLATDDDLGGDLPHFAQRLGCALELSKLDDMAAVIREKLLSASHDLLMRIPLDAYIESLDGVGLYATYSQTAPEVDAWCREIIRQGGNQTLEDYHKLLLLTLIKDFDLRAQRKRYPESVFILFARHFRGILSQISQERAGGYLYDNDLFRKDLGICRQRLIPCGAQFLDAMSGIPRSWLGRGGVKQAAELIRLVVGKLSSFRPLYQMHMDRRLVLEFNPQGWQRCYIRIAELLKLNPQICGVFGASWWFDPQLSQISPRLWFLRELPEAHGAKFFFVSEDEDSTKDALINSPERQRRYNEGSYRPKRYALVWARQDLIDWAKNHSALVP